MPSLQALQDYVPHLLAIMRCTENDSLLVRGIPVFDWRSTLSTTNAKLGRASMPSLCVGRDRCFGAKPCKQALT